MEKTGIYDDALDVRHFACSLGTEYALEQLLPYAGDSISTEDLRRMLCFGCASEVLSPEGQRLAAENGLCGFEFRNLPGDALQEVVVRLLKPSREPMCWAAGKRLWNWQSSTERTKRMPQERLCSTILPKH